MALTVNPREKTDRGDVAPVRVEEGNRLRTTSTGSPSLYREHGRNFGLAAGAAGGRPLFAPIFPGARDATASRPRVQSRGGPVQRTQRRRPQRAFLAAPIQRERAAVGSTIRLGTLSYPIVGVVPDSFRFPSSDVDVWTAAGLPPRLMTNRYARIYTAVGRLREGVSASAGQAELAGVQAQLAMQFPKTDAHWTALVEPLKEETVGGARRSLWILYGAVSLVLLIACANVACLLLAQARQRRREIAIRFSLGARRWQVVRELLLESFWLALPGSICGLLLSIAGAGLLREAAAAFPRSEEIHVDWRIVAFTLSLSLLTTILFGLFPAFAATREETEFDAGFHRITRTRGWWNRTSARHVGQCADRAGDRTSDRRGSADREPSRGLDRSVLALTRKTYSHCGSAPVGARRRPSQSAPAADPDARYAARHPRCRIGRYCHRFARQAEGLSFGVQDCRPRFTRRKTLLGRHDRYVGLLPCSRHSDPLGPDLPDRCQR